jgi:glyceraldehyde-3-phosphate dehydrogenase/erythrose-4-phosphate dehydrogenase
VIHESIGITRAVITTIHDMTNTQVVVDIYPELIGKLTGLAVRVRRHFGIRRAPARFG